MIAQDLTSEQPIHVNYDKKLIISLGESHLETKWKNEEMSWRDFLNRISITKRTDKKGSDGCFVGGSIKGGRRKVENIVNRSMVTLDADSIDGDFLDGIESLFDNAYAVYTTHSHTKDKPRYRIVIPLSDVVTPEQYQPICRKLAERFGIDNFDHTSYRETQLMYFPTTKENGEFQFGHQDAPFINPEDILDEYADWKDVSEWPIGSEETKAIKKSGARKENPREIPGMVGAFCRTYSISEAIEIFLQDKYTPGSDDRYSFVGGSTSNGAVIYDDTFIHSHHNTDPISGSTQNAYDLVRMHLYGEMDIKSNPNTPINRLPSVKAFNEYLLSKDEKVRVEHMKAKLSAAEEDFLDEEDTEIRVQSEGQAASQEITDTLLARLSCSKNGEIEPTTKNIEIIIETLYGDSFKFDEFALMGVRVKDLPFAHIPSVKSTSFVLWDDKATDFLITEIEKTFGMNIQYSKARIIIDKLIHNKRFHPVRDLINGTEWDGVDRAETLLIDYLGADDNEYSRLVTIYFLKSIIYRIFEPGCKVDEVLVLKGAQGIAKSLFVRKLSIKDRWFTESLEHFNSKQGGEVLQGKVIIELGELAAMKKSAVENVKRFISTQSDYFRPAYARTAKEFPRQCVFIGTTNEDEFLVDPTGNRRFLPVECDENKRIKHPADMSVDNVLQIYAEVKQKHYEPFKAVYMDDKLKALSLEAQNESTLKDPAISDASIYLNKPVPLDFNNWDKVDRKRYINLLSGAAPDDFNSWADEQKLAWFNQNSDNSYPVSELILREVVSAKELAEEGLGVDTTTLSAYQMRRYTNILKQVGWVQNGERYYSKAYGRQRCMVRPEL